MLLSQDLRLDSIDAEEYIHPEPMGKKSDKAMKFLGRDISKEKLMDRLGMEAEDLKQAEQDLIERNEKELERVREIEGVKNKREAQKALEILGCDPSTRKVLTHPNCNFQLMNRLGVEECVIEEARIEQVEREEEQIARKRKNSGNSRRSAQKALEVLGFDPSKRKVMETLGIISLGV